MVVAVEDIHKMYGGPAFVVQLVAILAAVIPFVLSMIVVGLIWWHLTLRGPLYSVEDMADLKLDQPRVPNLR